MGIDLMRTHPKGEGGSQMRHELSKNDVMLRAREDTPRIIRRNQTTFAYCCQPKLCIDALTHPCITSSASIHTWYRLSFDVGAGY